MMEANETTNRWICSNHCCREIFNEHKHYKGPRKGSRQESDKNPTLTDGIRQFVTQCSV